MEKNRLISLQIARGIAASIVFIMHLFNMAAAQSGSELAVQLAHIAQHFGKTGVDIFFVLSGMVISGIAIRASDDNRKTRSRPALVADFLLRRAARVYPLYWMTLAALLILPPIPGADNSLSTLWENPASVFLLTTPAAHPVAWTLVYEIQFYLVAALLLLLGKFTQRAFLIWAFVQIGIVIAARAYLIPTLPITDALSIEFSFGILIGMLPKLRSVSRPWLLMIISIAAAIYASCHFGPHEIANNTVMRVIVWGIPAAMFVISLVSLENKAGLEPGLISKTGDISYSIYMWHVIACLLTFMIISSLQIKNLSAFVLLYILVGTLLTWIISIASFRLVEKPTVAFFNSMPRRLTLLPGIIQSRVRLWRL